MGPKTRGGLMVDRLEGGLLNEGSGREGGGIRDVAKILNRKHFAGKS